MSILRLTTLTCLATVLAGAGPGGVVARSAARPEKIGGYAEYRKGDTLIVDGQRIIAGQKSRAVTDTFPPAHSACAR